MGSSDKGRGRTSKVARLIEEYNLDGVGAQLEARWTADDPDTRSSLRDLAMYFNKQLLHHVLKEAGKQPVDGEIENMYRLLIDEDVSAADRTRMERRLERSNINVDGLRDDFVSYQAVRTYLREERGAEYSNDATDSAEQTVESILRLSGRTASVVETKINHLQRAGVLEFGSSFRTSVQINVICEECGSQYGVQDLLDVGGCDCQG